MVTHMQDNKAPAKTLAKPPAEKKSKWTKDDTELSILALPTTIWYILFCYLPIFGIILAFKDYKITPGASFLTSLLNSDWMGFENFKYYVEGGEDWGFDGLPAKCVTYKSGSLAVQDMLNGNIKYVIIDAAPAAAITEAINEMQ